MHRPRPFLVLFLVCLSGLVYADDWPQGGGAAGDFQSLENAPTAWSVVQDKNIAWRITLPETGQSTPVIADGKVFFSTYEPVVADSEFGKNIVAWCCDVSNGEILWQRKISGQYELRLSGCFSDSTAPPAVCDVEAQRVVFVNASGTVACFDFDGEPVWSKKFLSVGRTVPFLSNGRVVLTRQVYPPDPGGVFPHKYKDSPKEMWTQLQALDMANGKVVWTTQCGVNMGCVVLPQKLSDGREVAVAGRGGGHGPPEKPDGISLVDLKDGSTIWTLELKGFMATMSYRFRNDHLHLFHAGEHLSVDAKNGETEKRASIVGDVPVCRMNDGERVTQSVNLELTKGKTRMITQSSNLLVGKFHYFRSYIRPWLGRVNVETGKVEYLELPLQLSRGDSGEDALLRFVEPKAKSDPKLEAQTIVESDMKNSRGFVVIGDKRSRGSGWGHIASPVPSVAGDHLHVPVMTGTVYVIRWNAEVLDESAVVAINDLGPAGKSWARGSLSFSDGKAFAHTMRELICIGE
jgi:outer membrane protein assembly factor BamB